MTTASRYSVGCADITKFCEARPSPTMRRDEKIRALARSVQEITESEEEEDESQVGQEDLGNTVNSEHHFVVSTLHKTSEKS
ncbi:unnamed protein product [Heligmosomoides polygyrus]|uniref:Uncharacterized protein n=1 Tax=Heligmosomoides polygyrus TaxID=6339 RepID=A0A183FIK6_HELPZ|nr:unnamed protein product [Heligmosomoides polygyrus]